MRAIFVCRNNRTCTAALLAGLAIALLAVDAKAAEYPIGTPQHRFGMEIAAVYLQPIAMEPGGMMRAAKDSDVHMEADIHALAGNKNGFQKGDWIPYLKIKYEITREGSSEIVRGDFMPMVAQDGPHYGDNIKLMGVGKYRIKYTVYPPSQNPHSQFGRHTDHATGVQPWFAPFSVEYEFIYAGTGKRGGY